MGGAMTYSRFVHRNGLVWWGYRALPDDPHKWDTYNDPVLARTDARVLADEYLSGELRRMEADQLNDLASYARVAGCTEEQAGAVLRAFLGVPEPGCEDCARFFRGRSHGNSVLLGRCQNHVVYGIAKPPTEDT